MVYLAQVWSVRQLDSLSSKHVHFKSAFGLSHYWFNAFMLKKKNEFLIELQELIQFVWISQFLLHDK